MAVSSKDLETLWQRYTVEAVPAGFSVNQSFESCRGCSCRQVCQYWT